jgi:hypothetical protein
MPGQSAHELAGGNARHLRINFGVATGYGAAFTTTVRRDDVTRAGGYALRGVGVDIGVEQRTSFALPLKVIKPYKSKMLRQLDEAESLHGSAIGADDTSAQGMVTRIEYLLDKMKAPIPTDSETHDD